MVFRPALAIVETHQAEIWHEWVHSCTPNLVLRPNMGTGSQNFKNFKFGKIRSISDIFRTAGTTVGLYTYTDQGEIWRGRACHR